MTFLRTCLVVLLLIPAAFDLPARAQQPPPQQQDEFIPIEKLPPQDQLPAAPLLVAAHTRLSRWPCLRTSYRSRGGSEACSRNSTGWSRS